MSKENYFEEQWKGYKKQVYQDQLPKHQEAQLRAAFLAGMTSALMRIYELGKSEAGMDDAVKELDQMFFELGQSTAKVKKELEKSEGKPNPADN